MKGKKIAIAGALLVAIGAGWYFTRDYLSFAAIKEGQAQLQEYYAANQALMLAAYFCVYVIAIALSLPGAALMTLAAGALFGFVVGSILVSFASTIGATLAFLVVRYLVGDAVQKRYADQLEKFNTKFDQEGAFYLFALRLIPVVPFFLINILMALTRIRATTFYWVSQLGMLAGTLVYVNAGTQLAKIDSAAGILSPALLASFALLGLVPLVAKKVVGVMRARRASAAKD